MGFRFRKSFKIGKGTRINLSKSGIGVSSGVKGARVSVNQKGVRQTASIPGTGMSYSTYKSHNSRSRSSATSYSPPSQSDFSDYNRFMPKAPYVGIFIPVIFLVISIMCLVLALAMPLSLIGTVIFGYIAFKQYRFFKSNLNKSYKVYNKGISRFLKNQYGEARELFIKSIEINDTNPMPNNAMAILNYHEGRYGEVQSYAYKAIDSLVTSPELLNHLVGLSAFRNGDYSSTIEALENYIEDDNEYKFVVGISYYKIGEPKKASEILKTGPVNKRTYTDEVLGFKYWLGISYLELGEKEKAIRQLKTVYDNDSNFLEVINYAKELNFAVGEHLE